MSAVSKIANGSKQHSGMVSNLHALRGIAAMMVVFHHTGIDVNDGAHWLGGVGAKGVDLFFVISGFIMVFTTMKTHMTVASFINNRVVRIVPLYWLFTFLVFGLAAQAPALFKATRPDLSELTMSLLFIPFVKANGLTHPMLPVGWTLNYEMFFYSLFALGLLLPKREIGVVTVTVVLALLVAIGQIAKPAGVISSFYTQPLIVLFGYGMLLGLVWQRLQAGPGLKVLAFFSLAITSILFLFGPSGLLKIAAPLYGVLAAGIVGSLLILERCGAVLTWFPARLLGDASYSIYLTHTFVTGAIGKLCRIWPPSLVGVAVIAFLTIVACAAVGIAVYRWLEQPLTIWAKRLHFRKSFG